MELIYVCAALLLSFTGEFAGALECYQCDDSPGEANANCADPFDMAGITKDAACMGRCFARLISMTTEQGPMATVERGCMASDESCMPGCSQQAPEGAPPGTPTATVCTYCCDDNLCNGENIQETAAAQPAAPPVEGSRKCWACVEVPGEATAGSCASNDFNGDDAQQEDCAFQCVATLNPDTGKFTRGCDPTMGMGICSAPDAPCCTEELCNVGSEAPTGDDDDDDDDTDVELIQCWKCDNSSDAEKCETGKFSEDSDTKVDCALGKCISFTMADSSLFIRDCVMKEYDEQMICDKDIDMFKDVKCCEKDLCNHAASLVATSSAIIFGTLFISVFYAIM